MHACKERSLGLLHPELIPEWHPTRNGNVTPFSVTYGSTKMAHWVCIKGHEWKAKIHSRAKGHGCKQCHLEKMALRRHDKIDVWNRSDNDCSDLDIIPTPPIDDEVLTCLICGEEFRSLQWHIKVSHAMTSDLYRKRFSLFTDFPMVLYTK